MKNQETMTCQFNNIEGYDDSEGFYEFDFADLEETIVATFCYDEDGELYIDHDARYFEYTESDNDIKVSGNF
tara:strand:- start:397 stop:612 length:216 start_codon:yes stop_codon:yes gene_type:complete